MHPPKTRLPSLDLPRGFTTLMIAPIHTVLVYASLPVRHTPLGAILGFIAEGPGAPLFMLLMGVNVAMSRDRGPGTVLTRSITLLLAAYGLNVLKFVAPLYAGTLPAPLLADLAIPPNTPIPQAAFTLFTTGDILHFAALSLPILYFITKLPHYPRQALLLALILTFLSPCLWDTAAPLLTGTAPRVFFPLATWLVYPLTGLILGHYLQREESFFVWTTLFLAGLTLLGAGAALGGTTTFYRDTPGGLLEHLGLVLVWLTAWHYAARYFKNGITTRLLTYASRNITQIYFIQWVVICWLIPVFGYQDLGLWGSMGAIVVTSGITLSLSLVLNLLRPKASSRRRP